MIYGVIPVGGKGTRLGLPYSKEMLPQKNYDHYNPIMNHVVEKMKMAGAKKIVFVHGSEFKRDVLEYFNDLEMHAHIMQDHLGFANVLRDAYNVLVTKDDDQLLFGLPDSVFDDNPFIEMIQKPGIVCGLFTTNSYSKVDRLSVEGQHFQVKTKKTDQNYEWFWGILKFDAQDVAKMIEDDAFERYSEIGHILNMYKFSVMHGRSYLDLGTWMNYNRYLSNENNFSNIEVERKYDAMNISREEFDKMFSGSDYKMLNITSRDYYFTSDNPNIEFIRYREKGNRENDGSVSDLTMKNFNKSSMNRYELTIPLGDEVTTSDVKQYCHQLGLKFEFDVEKTCSIFDCDTHTLVYYTFYLGYDPINIIEVELKKMDFNILSTIEDQLCEIPGFDIEKTINMSKFQMIKAYYDSTY